MKKLSSFLVIAVSITLFVLSSNHKFMKRWAQFRYDGPNFIEPDKYQYGDLYGFSYLKDYKFPAFKRKQLIKYQIKNHLSSKTHLYSICDSYLWTYMPNDSLLSYVNQYQQTRWDYGANSFYLDSSANNILLIERTERFLRSSFTDTGYVYQHLSTVPNIAGQKNTDIHPYSWRQDIFNPEIEQNIEFNLFDYPFFTAIKELKASINLHWFNRINRDVIRSSTRQQLYYTPTIDSKVNTSSFNTVTNEEIDLIVEKMNAIYNHYKRIGFKEVYLVMLPNPVTILEPNLDGQVYNQLIPRIQSHPQLRIPTLDMYSQLRSMKGQNIYQRSDTHWDKAGFMAFRQRLDSTLAQYSAPRTN